VPAHARARYRAELGVRSHPSASTSANPSASSRSGGAAEGGAVSIARSLVVADTPVLAFQRVDLLPGQAYFRFACQARTTDALARRPHELLVCIEQHKLHSAAGIALVEIHLIIHRHGIIRGGNWAVAGPAGAELGAGIRSLLLACIGCQRHFFTMAII
jgi:hypothetical protein